MKKNPKGIFEKIRGRCLVDPLRRPAGRIRREKVGNKSAQSSCTRSARLR